MNNIILGTAQFGLNYGINNNLGKINEEEISKILDFSFKNGINIIDTADAYGDATSTIGKYLKISKNKFQVNTKFNVGEVSIEKQLNTTLKKLNINNINTYFFHNYNDFKIYGKKIIDLKNSGLVKKIGLSVYSNQEFEVASKTSWIDVIQFPYNLLDNKFQRVKQLEKAKKRNKEIQARSVFLQGLFFLPVEKLPKKLNKLKPYINEIHKIILNNKICMTQLCLNYVMSNKLIDNIIIGIDSLQQLDDNIKMLHSDQNEDLNYLIDCIKVVESDLLYPYNWNQ